jgi:hypothetical protein
MRYEWIEKDGHYCAASEWQPAHDKPEEWRLVFKIARITETNAHLLNTRLDFSGSQLVYYRPGYGHMPTATGIMGDTVCDEHEVRAIPKPKVSRRRTKCGEVKVTDWTWGFCRWVPIVRYEAA